MNWFPFTYIFDNLITNSIHAWLTKDYRSSGMTKINVELLWDFGVENIPVLLQCGVHNSWRFIMFTMPFNLGLDWKLKKGHTTVNIELCKIFIWTTSLYSYNLICTDNLWRIIVFAMCWHQLPFVQDLVWNIKNIRQKATSNSSEILMCIIIL